MKNQLKKSYDYIIVGSGPGGGTVAKELAKAGKSVLIVEKGARHEKALGFPFGTRLMKKMGLFSKSVEGVYIGSAITLGGCSMVYNANVFDPPGWLIDKMGIDFRKEADEVKNEIGVKILPERFFEKCTGGNMVREAASKMGITFKEQQKFIDPDKCVVGCDWCMLGCSRNAKWTSRVYVDEAISNGADLMVATHVNKVIIDNGKAIGIELKRGKKIYGDKVILAAGGVGTPMILLNSGIKNAGKNFFMDPMNVITGYADDKIGGAWKEMTFTHAIEEFEDSEGFIIGNVSAAYASIIGIMRANVFRKNFYKLPIMRRGIGLFVKLADSSHGEVYKNGKMSKPFIDIDYKKMNKGTELAKEILVKAGVKSSSLAVGQWIGGHPGGTAAMGTIVDKNFQTEYENLYVCDASVLPQSPGVPPTLIILGMSKYFSKMLLEKG